MGMKEFDAKVKKLVEKMEDVAGEIFDNENVKEYFIESYDFDECNAMGVLIDYIKDNYIDVE